MHETKRDVVVVPDLIHLIFEAKNSQKAVGKRMCDPCTVESPAPYPTRSWGVSIVLGPYTPVYMYITCTYHVADACLLWLKATTLLY